MGRRGLGVGSGVGAGAWRLAPRGPGRGRRLAPGGRRGRGRGRRSCRRLKKLWKFIDGGAIGVYKGGSLSAWAGCFLLLGRNTMRINNQSPPPHCGSGDGCWAVSASGRRRPQPPRRQRQRWVVGGSPFPAHRRAWHHAPAAGPGLRAGGR